MGSGFRGRPLRSGLGVRVSGSTSPVRSWCSGLGVRGSGFGSGVWSPGPGLVRARPRKSSPRLLSAATDCSFEGKRLTFYAAPAPAAMARNRRGRARQAGSSALRKRLVNPFMARHEWINEILTVPFYYLRKPQPRERVWDHHRGKKTLLSLTLVRLCETT